MKRHSDPALIEAVITVLRQYNKPGDFDIFVPRGLQPDLKECVQAQARIGWTGFLEGLLSSHWAKYQQRYYKSIHSQRSGVRWATELSKQLWQLVFTMWDHRNNALFDKDTVDKLSGLEKVRRAIAMERRIGLGNLDQSFAPYFNLPTSSFTTMKAINLRRWLSLIRQARENKGYNYTDEFDTSAALRAWIGLTVKPQHHQHNQRRQERQRQQAQLHCLRTGYRE